MSSHKVLSSSSPTPNYQICDSDLLSHPGASASSSRTLGQNSIRVGTLKSKRVSSSTAMKRHSRRSNDKILPEDFIPGPYTVIIDRRKGARQAPGNQRLRRIAMSFLREYANTSDKPGKSRIVTTIWQMLEDICSDGCAFVRPGPNNRWYTVRDSVATEKVGYTLRELLGERYRSSSTGKKMVRFQSYGTDDSSSSWGTEEK